MPKNGLSMARKGHQMNHFWRKHTETATDKVRKASPCSYKMVKALLTLLRQDHQKGSSQENTATEKHDTLQRTHRFSAKLCWVLDGKHCRSICCGTCTTNATCMGLSSKSPIPRLRFSHESREPSGRTKRAIWQMKLMSFKGLFKLTR